MKTILILILTSLLIHTVKAQNKTAKIYGYRNTGNQIIFEFNPQEYTIATEHTTGKTIQLKDISIHTIQVAGDFNDWGLNNGAYKMSKTVSQTYTLIKSIKDLKLHKTLGTEFEFLINNSLWVEPPSNALNIRSTGLINKSTNLMLINK
jgi:hypothetical protein